MRSRVGSIGRRVRSSLFAGVAGGLLLVTAAAPFAAHAQQAGVAKVEATDQIILKDGRIIKGKILEETSTTVKMTIVVAGISADNTYDKAQILSIQRDAIEAAPATDARPATRETRRTGSPARASTDGAKVYTIHLKGWLGEDISQTPIREAVRDAKANGAEYLVVIVENDWDRSRFGGDGEIPDEVGQFDQLFRAEEITPIFTSEIPTEWENPPQIVFWVKRAMGGTAFLPLVGSNIYFSSEGKMGGIGGVEKAYGSTGDEVVREKQFSLRLGHAEGIAITGGHDPRLIRAMARTDYVLSVGFDGGRPVYHEGMPRADRGEILLTDDGMEDREDTIQQLARGEGNDTLTLNSDIAFKLGVSKGTVDTFEDLMRELGIARAYTQIPGKSDMIMQNWRDGVARAKRDLESLWRDFGRIQVQGDYAERTRARGQQLRILDDMEKTLRRYEESLNPGQIGVPGVGDIGVMRQRIRLEQARDRK